MLAVNLGTLVFLIWVLVGSGSNAEMYTFSPGLVVTDANNYLYLRHFETVHGFAPPFPAVRPINPECRSKTQGCDIIQEVTSTVFNSALLAGSELQPQQTNYSTNINQYHSMILSKAGFIQPSSPEYEETMKTCARVHDVSADPYCFLVNQKYPVMTDSKLSTIVYEQPLVTGINRTIERLASVSDYIPFGPLSSSPLRWIIKKIQQAGAWISQLSESGTRLAIHKLMISVEDTHRKVESAIKELQTLNKDVDQCWAQSLLMVANLANIAGLLVKFSDGLSQQQSIQQCHLSYVPPMLVSAEDILRERRNLWPRLGSDEEFAISDQDIDAYFTTQGLASCETDQLGGGIVIVKHPIKKKGSNYRHLHLKPIPFAVNEQTCRIAGLYDSVLVDEATGDIIPVSKNLDCRFGLCKIPGTYEIRLNMQRCVHDLLYQPYRETFCDIKCENNSGAALMWHEDLSTLFVSNAKEVQLWNDQRLTKTLSTESDVGYVSIRVPCRHKVVVAGAEFFANPLNCSASTKLDVSFVAPSVLIHLFTAWDDLPTTLTRKEWHDFVFSSLPARFRPHALNLVEHIQKFLASEWSNAKSLTGALNWAFICFGAAWTVSIIIYTYKLQRRLNAAEADIQREILVMERINNRQ